MQETIFLYLDYFNFCDIVLAKSKLKIKKNLLILYLRKISFNNVFKYSNVNLQHTSDSYTNKLV